MKRIKKLLFALVMVMAFTVVSPSVMTDQTTTVHAAAKISKKNVTLIKGQTAILKISGTKKKVKWSTNKKSVATVTQKGKVTAKKTGTAKITAKIGSKKYICTVKVQTPKLSKTKVNVNAGDTYTLKLSGTDQKVTWKSSKTSVATINSKGVITAKKAGTAKITATVLKKKYTCTVTVKKKSNINVEKFDAEKAKKNIDIKFYDTQDGVLAILKNNSKYLIYLQAKLIYYKDGKIIDVVESDINSAFENGRSCFLSFRAPRDSNYRRVKYDSYKMVFSEFGEQKYEKAGADKIRINSNVGTNGIIVTATNDSNENFDAACIFIIFYDKNGNIINTDYSYSGACGKGETDYITFNYPYDEEYENIIPHRYEVYVNYAYRLTL